MRFSLSTTLVASLVSLATISSAAITATGYGRFTCTIVNGDGTFSPDATQCFNANLSPPGSDTPGTGTQGNEPTPVDPVCTKETETGAYFCGIAGASCTSDANCDNGNCVGGICQGGFTQACASDDLNCSGFLYCLSGDFSTTPSDTCGGIGSFCQDATQGDPAFPDAENYAIFNQFCSSGYCNFGTGDCDTHGTTVGADCSSDPEFYCTITSTSQALTCDATTSTCQLAAIPSGRARSRLSRRQIVCPHGHSLCPVAHDSLGGGAKECIDTASNLESCGGCPGQGGVDCSALPGVSASSCQDSRCEIWACLDTHRWSAEDEACVEI
ncbi:hypothetical protein JCM3766R1_000516 [Sporobolomyces carnicolor]